MINGKRSQCFLIKTEDDVIRRVLCSGSFQTSAVVDHLFELIDDSDPNTRAVAALALAKTGEYGQNIAALSLGYPDSVRWQQF